MLALGARVAPMAALLNKPAEIQVLIVDEVNLILSELQESAVVEAGANAALKEAGPQ
jgi:uncharacterized spore protein YtfJ